MGEKEIDFGKLSRADPGKGRKLKVSYILFLLLLIGAGAFTLYRLNLKKKLQARIEAIRAAGYPVTYAELDDWYTIPETAKNAADIILDAFDYYQEPQDSNLLLVVNQAELPVRTEPLPEETMKLASEYLRDNQQTIELLYEAAALEHSRYPVDLSLGRGILTFHLSDLRKFIKLLNLEAVFHVENNNPQLAARSVTSALGIAHSLAKEPLLYSQLVRFSSLSLAVSTLEHVMNKTDLTDKQLEELGQSFTDAQDLSALSRAFVGERCMAMSFFAEPRTITREIVGDQAPPGPILELYEASGLADKDAITYLDLMETYINIHQIPLHERQAALKTISLKRRSISKIHIILNIFAPSFSSVTTYDLRTIAELRTAQAALAVQRYRLATGKLPETLSELVPDYLESVPTDPFDGEELRYRKLEAGYVVYSIGEDLKDDGGTEMPTDSKERRNSKWDVTFIVER